MKRNLIFKDAFIQRAYVEANGEVYFEKKKSHGGKWRA